MHWAPNIITDTEGKAQGEFYNGDNIGDMLIIVEGIAKTESWAIMKLLIL